MKTLRYSLTAFAFIVAITATLATIIQEGYYYDVGLGRAVRGTIDQTTRNCLVQSGTICTINGEWAYNTAANAESAGTWNPNAPGLLKHQ